MNTITKGDLTVLSVATALAKRGERILIPFSQAERYDIALDRGGRLYRIQCKTGRFQNGSIEFNTASHGPRVERRIYASEVDAFGVYCRDTDACYLVPVEAVADSKTCAMLRVAPVVGKRSVRYASDFAI